MVVVGSQAKAAPLQAVGNRTSHKRAAIFEDDNDAVTLGTLVEPNLASVLTFAPPADVAKGGDGAKFALRLCVRFFLIRFLPGECQAEKKRAQTD